MRAMPWRPEEQDRRHQPHRRLSRIAADPKEWALYTLLDFDREAIEQFAAKWCLAFEKSTLGDTPEARASAEAERRSLLGALDANPGVANLASNPLLLTILALIKRQGVSLPNRRVELYELYLKTLDQRVEQSARAGQEAGGAAAGLPADDRRAGAAGLVAARGESHGRPRLRGAFDRLADAVSSWAKIGA